MQTINKINQIGKLLIPLIEDVYHYNAPPGLDRYIVWAEDGETSSISGNNKKDIQTLEGTIDFYTKTESDILVDEIQSALNNANISYRLNSIQYEDETQLIHYEWVWSI